MSKHKKIIDFNKLTLRQITIRDCDLLFQWFNEKQTIANSVETFKKVSKKDHNIWFNNAFKNKNIKIYIFEIDSISIGQIRLESKEGKKYSP